MQQNKNSPILNILQNRLEMRRRRALAKNKPIPAQDAPLDGQETMVFDMLYKQLIKKSGLSSAEAETALQSCIATYGKKAMVDIYIEQPLVMGIPYMHFVCISITCMIAFIILHHIAFLFIAFPLHLASYFYYQKNRERIRQEQITTIITQGIK